jgi:hypothetical protein
MVFGGSMSWQAHRKLSWSAYVQVSMVKSVVEPLQTLGGKFRAFVSVVEYTAAWGSSAVVPKARDRSPSQLQTFVVGASNNCQKAANLGSELPRPGTDADATPPPRPLSRPSPAKTA